MLQREDVTTAAQRLSKVAHKTPLELCSTFSEMSGAQLYLKLENQQKTGSFKLRGAYNKIARLMESPAPPASIIACSAGNHAQGVAFSASALGVRATIVMPKSTPLAKVCATQEYGAHVILHGDCYDDTYRHALELQKEEGSVFIHPFNDYDVMAGQATVGLEILQDLEDVDTVLVPAGGGGLLAGIAFYLKSVNPRIRVIGVQASGAGGILESFRHSEVASLPSVQTIADGIAVKQPGDLTMKIINRYVDDMIGVSDDDIAAAILLLLERTKQVVEPAGAASLAAALQELPSIAGKKTVCVLSGGNIDVSFIHRIIEKGLIRRGRQMKFQILLPDTPGELENIARIIARAGANVIMVQHDRLRADLSLTEAILHIVCEVGGPEHGQRVMGSLQREGYPVTVG